MTVPMPEMPSITASDIGAPPTWALLQRKLISHMEQAAPVMSLKYADRGGTWYWSDDMDDYYERSGNWCLLYALGGGEHLVDLALKHWNATNRLFDDRDGNRANNLDYYHGAKKKLRYSIHNEYFSLAHPGDAEWHHMGEGNMAFYDFGVAAPSIDENRRRAEKFAAMYIGEDPEAPNYDPNRRVIRSPMPTSQGPMHENTPLEAALWLQGGIGKDYRYYGIRGSLSPIIDDREREWYDNPARQAEVTRLFNEIVLQADTPNNLAATALVTNAYLFTGIDKYKKWVLDYTEAWIERMWENDGLMPDNVGPTGIVGERRNGQWWGGMHGWNHYQGYNVMFHGLTIAAECCQMLTGDEGYLELLRSQIELMLSRSYEAGDGSGKFVTPNRYDHGWGHYRHAEPKVYRFQDLAHLFHASMSEKDRQLVHALRAGDVGTDWNEVPPTAEKGIGVTEKGRFQYYEGLNPDWPEKILSAEYESALTVFETIQNDPRDREQIKAEHKNPPNPVYTKGLTQVTMGAPQSVYCGGLLRATVRYLSLIHI